MKNTTLIGDIAEAKICAALLAAKYTILLPFSSACRYDIAIEKDGKLFKIQCKNAPLKNGSIRIPCYSVNCRTGKQIPYLSQIDFYGVYCPDIEKCYLVPSNIAGVSSLRLRINNSLTYKNSHSADEFEIRAEVV